MAGTDDMIECLVKSAYPLDETGRNQHTMREALRALVRLAQAEQMLAMRASIDALIYPHSTKH